MAIISIYGGLASVCVEYIENNCTIYNNPSCSRRPRIIICSILSDKFNNIWYALHIIVQTVSLLFYCEENLN